jgi:hypothetical protein
MRVAVSKRLAMVVVMICVGLQVLEDTGRWDRTLLDSQDEATIVTTVLCIGAAVAVARASRSLISAPGTRPYAFCAGPAPFRSIVVSDTIPIAAGPPVRLRV